MDFYGIRERLRTKLKDANKIRWSDAELEKYINEGQEEYAERAYCLIGTADIIGVSNGVYSVPADFLAFIKFTYDGRDIPCVTWDSLLDWYSNDFLTTTDSSVSYICFDLHSWNQFRIYPNQADGASSGTLYYARKPVANTLEVSNWQAVYQYALAQCYLRDGEDFLGDAQHYLDLFEKESMSYPGSKITRDGKIPPGSFF